MGNHRCAVCPGSRPWVVYEVVLERPVVNYYRNRLGHAGFGRVGLNTRRPILIIVSILDPARVPSGVLDIVEMRGSSESRERDLNHDLCWANAPWVCLVARDGEWAAAGRLPPYRHKRRAH